MEAKMHKYSSLKTTASGDKMTEIGDLEGLGDRQFGHAVNGTRKRWRSEYLIWIFHLTAILVYGFLFFKSEGLANGHSSLLSEEAYDGLLVNIKSHKTGMASPYHGRPKQQSEDAWHQLLNVGIVSITEEERARLHFETAPNAFVKNEFVVELNVFHQLHCLYGLRKQLYNPRHLSWTHEEPVTFWEFHMDHCIEHLRESLMCNADLTPQRFDWDADNFNYMLDRHQQFPRCKNFGDVWSWSEMRNTTGDTPGNIGGLERPADSKRLKQ